MKKIILFAFLCLCVTGLYAQDSPDVINSIYSKDETVNNIDILGKDKSVLIQDFGKPLYISKEYWETEYDTAMVYHYEGIIFYILKGRVNSFDIVGSKWSFSPYHMKVGENVEKFQNVFPLSLKNRDPHLIYLYIKDCDDCGVRISVDSNNVITKIALADYD